MRTAVLFVALTLGLVSTPIAIGDVVAAPQTASPEAAAQPPVQADVDVDMDRGGAWYTSPTWIAIGVIAIVLLIVIVAMASRGGGTTIVRE